LTDRLTISEYKALAKKKLKYHNKPVVIDGISCQSTKEGERYKVLKLAEKAGEIRDLKLQVSFPFVLNKVKICSYNADFTYVRNGQQVVEDTKSEATRKNRVYRLKKKMMKAFFGIDILET